MGDNAYKSSNHVLVPWPGKNLSCERDSYNFWQSHARINIECAFGMLVRKWLILSRGIDIDLEHAVVVINACCLLHNYTHHLGPIVMNSTDVNRDGGCSTQPTYCHDTHTTQLDDHRIVATRTGKTSTYRDLLTADLKQAGMLRPGKESSDYSK